MVLISPQEACIISVEDKPYIPNLPLFPKFTSSHAFSNQCDESTLSSMFFANTKSIFHYFIISLVVVASVSVGCDCSNNCTTLVSIEKVAARDKTLFEFGLMG